MSVQNKKSSSVQRSTTRKRLRALPVINPANENEVINPMHFVQNYGHSEITTATTENHSKRQKIDLQHKRNENTTLESGPEKLPNVKNHTQSITSVNDDVLLHVFRYLNWMDSINLFASSKRFHQLNNLWLDKRRQKFVLDDYLEITDHLPTIIMPQIAPNIKVLETSVDNITKDVEKLYRNVKSLRVNYKISRSAARKINLWIKKSNVECFRFNFCDDLDVLFDGVTSLLELEINYVHRNTEQIIEKNINLERLSVELDTHFNFRAFRMLQALQSLHIRSSDVGDLGKIQELGNLESLTEFSFQCDTFSDEPHILNSFLKHLSDVSNLKKLQLVDCVVDGNTFAALKSFNLTALNLCCDVSSHDLMNFILANSLPRLKHLKLSSCSFEHVSMLLEKWTSLETFCLYVDEDEKHKRIRDSTFITKILETSRSRSQLTIHLMANRESEISMHTEIYINFAQHEFKLTELMDEFCCSHSKSFTFSPRNCFHY